MAMTRAEQRQVQILCDTLNTYRHLVDSLDEQIALQEQQISLLRQVAIRYGAPIGEVNQATAQPRFH